MRNGLLALALCIGFGVGVGCDDGSTDDNTQPGLYEPCAIDNDCEQGLACDSTTDMCTRACSIDAECTSGDVVGRCLVLFDTITSEPYDQLCVVACTEHAEPCVAQGVPDSECISFSNGNGPVEQACSFYAMFD